MSSNRPAPAMKARHRKPAPDLLAVDSLARRRCLARLAALAVAGPGSMPVRGQWKAADDPFTLGVASGDPAPDGFVLWTRLAPQPVQGGGMPDAPVPVDWTIATDESMKTIVRRGTETAVAQLAHAVHVEVEGLMPGREYWYRFSAGGAQSVTGRTRTAPATGAPVSRLRFAFASCQHFEHGLYAAYRHLAEEDLDVVLHLGDYIYETSGTGQMARRHESAQETVSLAQYRNRYACYKQDPHLRLAHQRFPWIVTWDDHEVENDYAADQSQDRDDPKRFLERRTSAYQAWYEHMPLRRVSLPQGSELQVFRRLAFGDLATFHVLDNRQYRTDQVCGEGRGGGGNMAENCAARFDATATMWGPRQEQWLDAGLDASRSRWNVLAQSLMMAQFRSRSASGGEVHWTDGWDGYAHPRTRFLARLARSKPANPVSIGGDIHSYWANELKVDFDDEKAAPVAAEFIGTSISSRGIPYAATVRSLPLNPHVKFFDSRVRGYVRCEVTPRQWRTAFRAIERAADAGSPVRTLASFVVEDGRSSVLID